MGTIANLAASNAETAEFYRNYAGKFEPGSLGYIGNMAEAAKYADMARRFGEIAEREAQERLDSAHD